MRTKDQLHGRIPCACCGLEICELTATESEVRPGDQPLPPFDPSVERLAPPRHSESLSDAIASGEIEVSREGVDIDEVIAKIEEMTKED